MHYDMELGSAIEPDVSASENWLADVWLKRLTSCIGVGQRLNISRLVSLVDGDDPCSADPFARLNDAGYTTSIFSGALNYQYVYLLETYLVQLRLNPLLIMQIRGISHSDTIIMNCYLVYRTVADIIHIMRGSIS